MKHKKQLGEGMEDIREENENIKNPFWDHGRKPTLYVCEMFLGRKRCCSQTIPLMKVFYEVK